MLSNIRSVDRRCVNLRYSSVAATELYGTSLALSTVQVRSWSKQCTCVIL